MDNAIDATFIIASFLKEHPDSVVYFEGSYFKYEPCSDFFYYCNPENKKRNGWYRARGLECWYKKFLNKIGGQIYV